MNGKTNNGKSSKGQRRVLQDHVKIRSTFYPSFLVNPRLPVQEVQWRDNIMPELIWMAMLVSQYGFRRARDIVYNLALVMKDVDTGKIQRNWTLTSSYAAMTASQWQNAVHRLSRQQCFHDLKKALLPMARLYPSCPFKALFEDCEVSALSADQAVDLMGPVMVECLKRGNNLPMLAQAIYNDVSLASGNTVLCKGVEYHNTEILADRPESEEAQNVGGFVRAFASMIDTIQKQFGLTWHQTFWAEGVKVGACHPEQVESVYPNTFPQIYLMYVLECFRKYNDKGNALWETIVKNYPMDLHKPLRREILLGLVCRMYRLAIHQVSFPVNWTEDLGQIYVRMLVESYIYYTWLSRKGTPEDFDKFYEYGLGQQKLYMEHIDNCLSNHGMSREDAGAGNLGAEFLRKHKLPAFIPVNVGTPLGKNLRELAEECECKEAYALFYGPCSSAVHGMYDTLDNQYLRVCVNPFHGGHRVPYYWYTKLPKIGWTCSQP